MLAADALSDRPDSGLAPGQRRVDPADRAHRGQGSALPLPPGAGHMQLPALPVGHGAGGAGEQAAGLLFFGEGDMISRPQPQRRDPNENAQAWLRSDLDCGE